MDIFDINRYALILTPSTALLKWAISEQPELGEDIDLDDTADLATVFLLPDFAEMEEAEDWVEAHYATLLENLLEEWIADDNLWPDRFEYSHFEKYADYTLSNIVIDTVDASYDEEESD
ncbi:hypothetical protein [Lewinella sp. 4G2]|uniref:hypothetical protein n=1 Tax=Lewinella sp. 4G2 TaxID=1803372 RepID=UPI0007B4D65C|nr:hypothetical protein [Lewinella sp. 4G2]OAV42719.1 hypothetical protein A3850_015885 [Lewinella sp. 4G2]